MFPLRYADEKGTFQLIGEREFKGSPSAYLTTDDLRKIVGEAQASLAVGSYRGMTLMRGAVGFEFGNKECILRIYALDIQRVRAFSDPRTLNWLSF